MLSSVSSLFTDPITNSFLSFGLRRGGLFRCTISDVFFTVPNFAVCFGHTLKPFDWSCFSLSDTAVDSCWFVTEFLRALLIFPLELWELIRKACFGSSYDATRKLFYVLWLVARFSLKICPGSWFAFAQEIPELLK